MHKLVYFLPVIILCFFYSGCKKETSSIGTHIQPPGDIAKTLFIDSTTVRAFTLVDDSITTNNRALTLWGCYNDPVFGSATASMLVHFNYLENFSFGTDPVADSLVLYLKYNSYYGNISTLQNIVIYKLIKQIYADSTYYSNKNIDQYYDSAATSVVANLSFVPRLADSVLTIKLSQAMADTLINLNSAAYTNNSVFVSNYFRGFYIKANNVASGGAIIYFDLLSTLTKLTMYYKNSTDTFAVQNFVINSSCSRINLFKHNYKHAVFYPRTTHIDTIRQDSVVYLQSMCGVKVKVSFPYIKGFIAKLGPIAINKAELVINKSSYDVTAQSFSSPAQLIALMPSITTTPGYSYLPDYNAGAAYFDGTYYTDTKSYKFNITMYIQKLINNNYSNSGIFLFSILDRTSAERVVLTSGKNSNPMKLLITYTKL